MMKQKGEAGEAIVRSMSKIQKLCERKTKSLHSDGAREQDTVQLRYFLTSNETIATHTAPNAS